MQSKTERIIGEDNKVLEVHQRLRFGDAYSCSQFLVGPYFVMNKREQEKAIFTAFLRVEPRFFGEEIIEWKQPEDEKEFPDVICVSESGLKVGVELGQWLNEDEIRHAKGMEHIQSSVLAAIGKQGDNTLTIFVLFGSCPSRKHISSRLMARHFGSSCSSAFTTSTSNGR